MYTQYMHRMIEQSLPNYTQFFKKSKVEKR